jgi:MoaA/NifB/PqqE/SkfB family radical SAM enzyme
LQTFDHLAAPAGASTCGILYVATGATCRAEAAVSARSVKAVWPQIPIAIKTDGPVDRSCFDQIDLVSDAADNLAKIRHLAETPFERTLLLDTDTYCLQPMPELFGILDRFDLAAAHEAGRYATRWEGNTEVFIRDPELPECFPEYNSGVMAFRRGPQIFAMFARWLALAEEARKSPVPHTQDQPSLRRAIYESGLRVAVLPPEYNFRLVCSGFARGPIKLIHGRWKYGPIGETPEQIFATLARTFNENVGPRTFVHAFGMICGHGPSAIPYDDPKRSCILGETRPLQDAIDTLTGEVDALTGEVRSLTDQFNTLSAEAEALRGELQIIKQSNSWRITRPLRFLRRKLFDLVSQAGQWLSFTAVVERSGFVRNEQRYLVKAGTPGESLAARIAEDPEIKPSRLRIEASSFCQLRCPSCPTTAGTINPVVGNGFLRFDNFRALIDDNPSITAIELSNYGEALLNPDLVAMLQYAQQRSVAVNFHNGVNLNNCRDGVLEALVKYQVQEVTCSLDGASQDTYHLYRVRGHFDRVIGNIRRINHYKELYRSEVPRLRWQFVVFGHNEHEIPAARAMAAELGMTFHTKLSWDAKSSPIRDKDFVRAATGEQAVTREEYEQIHGRKYVWETCLQLWEEPQINWDGKNLGCCRNFWGDFGGNAFKDGLTACLNHEKMRYARGMLRGQNPPRDDIPCTTCDLYQGMQASSNWIDKAHE